MPEGASVYSRTSSRLPTFGAAPKLQADRGKAQIGAAILKAWESVLPEWKSHKPEAAIASNKDDRTKLAAAVSSAAKAWKPPPSLAVPSIDDIGPDVPRNLHERLALVARLSLQEYLQDAVAQPTVVEFTTTDVTAALSVAGVIVSDKGKRTAIASLVACETERQMTWSRLEGLRFHWAVASGPKGQWELPPRGWKTLPDTTVDAGGAWQSTFEKHPLPQPGGGQGPEPMYTMLLSVPLEGPLEKGGVIFVLRSGGVGQNTAWLKDASTKSDFFLPVQKFATA
ncbi:hypothetical protein MNEG_1755 [Monoraphidium neglectum]|uniref:Uncharacterized protein n=1 Tax=Monoraphidium neglectum TaxID=145388 RepID=A0A0D2LIF1_9CHLO|nr:hypothetical protein MNEG_1755 [Monoraphidium neglectum]KIZ06204.1 hypothetical protein MNEG_1755 [Monoraphidium neglectum]|eukprot:XP_013905223.1 hypothetical protein MNEG_1755 [Monoraphidium neglectum]